MVKRAFIYNLNLKEENVGTIFRNKNFFVKYSRKKN